MAREYMKLTDLSGYLDRIPGERFNLYYWEGPGTTDYMVLNFSSKSAILAFATKLNNCFARWAVVEQKGVTL